MTTFIVDYVKYTILDSSNVSVTGSDSPPLDWHLIIPPTVTDGSDNEYIVATIGANAFKSLQKLASIVISDSVTSIGNSAFNQCYSLRNCVLPRWLTLISQDMMSGSTITSIIIPELVTTLYPFCFGSCASLTAVTFSGNSVTILNGSSFNGCTNLVDIVLPESLMYIGGACFKDCSKLKEIVIPDSVTSIISGEYLGCFANCIRLEKIILSNSLTSIQDQMFMYCSSLQNLVIPNNVKNIGNLVFGNSGIKNVIIGPSVTAIGFGAFSGCANLESVSLNCNITEVYSGSFEACTKIKSIVLPNSVKNIQANSFFNCSGMTSLVIPPSVTNIAAAAFGGDASLHSVYFFGLIPAISNVSGYGGLSQFINFGSTADKAFYTESAPNYSDLDPFFTFKEITYCPQNINLVPGDSIINCSWDQIVIANPNYEFVNYYVSYFDTADPSNNYESTPNTDITTVTQLLEGLTNYQTYECKVVTKLFFSGQNYWYESPSQQIIPYFNPTPTNFTVEAGFNSVYCTWDSSNSVHGYSIYGYKIFYYDTADPSNNYETSFITNKEKTIFGLTNYSTYRFSVVAYYYINGPKASSPSASVEAIPYTNSAPENFSINTIGDEQITCSWSAVITDLIPSPYYFIGYKVNYYIDGSDNVTEIDVSLNLTATISGLTNFKLYNFSVKAYYFINRVIPSLNSNVEQAIPYFIDAPQNLLVAPSDTQVTCSWDTVIIDPSFSISGYKVKYYIDGSNDFLETDLSTNTTITITGLVNYFTYNFSVTAYSNIGVDGTEISEPSSPVQGIPYFIDAPQNLLVAPSNAQVTCSWSPVELSDPSFSISGYKVKYYSSNPNDFLETDLSTNTTITITGLANYTTYNFSVTAYSDIDIDPGTEISEPSSTVQGIPYVDTAPQDFTVDPSDTQVTCSWSPVSPAITDPSYSFLGYKVKYYIDGSNDFLETDLSTNTTATITGLTNFIFYDFSVTGYYNINGTVPTKESDIITKMPFVINAPQNFDVVPSDEKVVCSWDSVFTDVPTPFLFLGYIVKYYINDSNDFLETDLIQDTTSIITGLTNYVTYKFSVTAYYDIYGEKQATSSEVQAIPYVDVAPQNFTVEPSDTQVTCSWDSVFDELPGEYSFLGYKVKYYIDGSNDFSETDLSQSVTATITGLTNFETYSFIVRAYYDISGQKISKPSSLVSSIPYFIFPPVISSLVPGNAQVICTWSAAQIDPSYSISGYKVTYYTANPDVFSETDLSTNTTTTITGLSNFETYTFSVIAYSYIGVNGLKPSEPSDEEQVFTHFINAPLNIQLDSINNNGSISINMSWDPAIIDNNTNSVSITKYQIIYYNTNNLNYHTLDVSGNITEKLLAGPFRKVPTYFQVRAFVDLHNSEYSDVVSFTPFSVTYANTLYIKELDNSLQLDWSLPNNTFITSANIQNYTIQYRKKNSNSVYTELTVSNTLQTTTITGLLSNTQYEVIFTMNMSSDSYIMYKLSETRN